MPRKSSTKVRSLSKRLSTLTNDTRTYPTYSPLRSHPPPISNNFIVVKRRIHVLQNTPATGLTDGLISTALEGVAGDYLIRNIDCYSVDKGTSNQPLALFTLKTSTVMPEELNNTYMDLRAQDYGTQSSLPAVSFILPRTRSKWFNKNTAGTNVLATCSTSAVFVVDVLQQLQA